MNPIRVDIVSDVVCPWCIVGLRQLQSAADSTGVDIDIHWHPFELNPQMSETGQDLQDHICEKYGTTVEESIENRQKLSTLGSELGFSFQYNENSRMVNTFKAHQLLHWAKLQGKEHALKLALFSAYFTEQRDVNDSDVLLSVVDSIDMDTDEASAVLTDGRHQNDVRTEQQLWTSRGITGVPAMVFIDKYLVTGAQGTEYYTAVLNKIVEDNEAS